MIFLYFGKRFRAQAAAQRLVGVTCEWCGTAYWYVLERTAVGRGTAPYLIDQRGAAERASAAAKSSLDYHLATEREVVPCPACQWVNADMADLWRARRYPHAAVLAVVVGVVGGLAAVVSAVTVAVRSGGGAGPPAAVGGAVAIATAAATVGVLVGAARLRRRFDPNAAHPLPPAVPPRGPPALLQGPDPITGQPTLLRATPASTPGVTRGAATDGGVTYRAAQLPALPAACCVCLTALPPTPARRAAGNGPASLLVPICDGCRWRARQRRWLAWAGAAAGSATVAAAVAVASPVGRPAERAVLAGIVLVVGTVVGGVTVTNRIARPYRLQVLDRGRGIVRFAARNPAYTSRVAEAVRAANAGERPLV